MKALSDTQASRARQPGHAQIGVCWLHLGAWLAVAAVNTAAIAAFVPWPKSGYATRLTHHFFDVGHSLALGGASLALVAAWMRWGSRRRIWTYAVVLLVAAVLGFAVLKEDLAGATRKLNNDEGSDAYLILLILFCALLVLATGLLGRWLARPKARWFALGLGCLGAFANHLVSPNAYHGLHFWLAWLSAILMATALTGVPLPYTPTLRRARNAAVVAAAIVASLSIGLWPSNTVVIELFRSPGSILTPYLARLHFKDIKADASAIVDPTWFEGRLNVSPIQPSAAITPTEDLIVIVISIDAVRADILDHDEWASHMPTFQALRSESSDFSLARSTGSQTVYTLSTMFSGKHFSQMYWSRRDENALTGEFWPWEDKTPRLGELLQEHGVKTMTMASASWLTSDAGVVRGFDSERRIRANTNRAHNMPDAGNLMFPAIAKLKQHEGGPLFLFMHFMDPHAPYNLGGRARTPLGRYAKEIGVVGKQIHKLIEMLKDTGRWNNTVLVVTSDHGEAFGEHNTQHHATTLYEELLRVPLIIYAPGIAPQVIDEPVSTIDIGPTVLDLFGIDTPGSSMGQSLVPLLKGKDAHLTRPIVAEGRLKQALVTREGIKAIRDLRKGTLEAYDLTKDPLELENIFWTESGKAALNQLRVFFDVHTYRDGGYKVPYRK